MRRILTTAMVALLVLATLGLEARAQDEEPRRRRAPEKDQPEKKKSTDESRRDDAGSDRDGRSVRDHRTTRDPNPPEGDETPDTPDPELPWSAPRLAPALPPANPPGTGYISDFSYERAALDCAEAMVCVLDPLDDYYAWMLAGETSIPYLNFALLRSDGLSWEDVLDELRVEPWEAYAAIGESDPDSEDPRALSDDVLRELARIHSLGISLPVFECVFPIELEGVPRTYGAGVDDEDRDFVAQEIASRITEETGWCRADLLEARTLLGSWGRVAKRLYLSPFLFEASFGIDLRIDDVGRRRLARYPTEREIRDVAETGAWPEATRR